MKQLPQNIHCLSGDKEGPTVVLLKKTHGDEVGGEMVVDLVVDRLISISRGSLYWGIGNPLASERNVRFVDSDLNRSYGKDASPGYEGQRAAELKPLLAQADYLLDVHSFRKPASPLICYPGNNFSGLENLTKHLPIETVVYGLGLWPPGGDHIYADTFVCSNGGLGLTIESGYLTDSAAIDTVALGVQRILQDLLEAKAHQIEVAAPANVKKYFEAYRNIIAVKNFSFSKEWDNFEFVPRGTMYATAGNKEYMANCDSYMLFPKAPDSIVEGDEVCILLERRL